MSFQTFISSEALAQHLDDAEWKIFDCRFFLSDPKRGERVYKEGHIPGALYADLDEDLAGPKTPQTGRHPLPEPKRFMQWLGDNGVDRTVQVVAYDDSGGATAGRLWWLLRWLGHDSVAVLDGGWPAWQQGGFPISTEITVPAPRVFKGTPNDDMYVTTAQLEDELSEVLLIDARGAPRFRGDKEPIDPVAGHIPGAINVPFAGNLVDNDRIASPRALKARFDEITAGSSKPVVHMCGSGVSACLNLLAMEHAGKTGSKLYVGSWSEWVADRERPVATGAE